jgi:tRNA pseudouridine(38-40) synthase
MQDIRVTRLERAPPGWHAQFSASRKLYLYQVPPPRPAPPPSHSARAYSRWIKCSLSGPAYGTSPDRPAGPQVYTGPVLDPFLAGFVHHVPARAGRFDVSAMRAAAAALTGTHDLTAFTKADPSRSGRLRPVKTIHRLEVAAGPGG